MMPPGARRITDPEAEVERLAAARAQPPGHVLCQEVHPLDTGSGSYAIEISIKASPALPGQQPAGLPFRADLGQRIAAMIRADCEAAE